MSSAILVALISLVGMIIGALFTYWSAKRRERETEWRKEKFAQY